MLEITKTNLSDHPFDDNRFIPYGAWSGLAWYQIAVKDEQGNLMPETDQFRAWGPIARLEKGPLIGKMVFNTVNPGQSVVDRGDVSQLYDMVVPGKYTIVVRSFDTEGKSLVHSNVITITVIP